MFPSIRDTLVEMIIEKHPIVKRLGKIHAFEINSRQRIISLRFDFVGEASPIAFKINYDIVSSSGKSELVVSKIACEREWISEILRLWLEEKGPLRYEIPGFAAGLAKIFF
ncbi:MAG: hypothetical protein LBR60_03725 [Fibrobacter sp.]|jgi:hypothetical protein|nr:hypothetical protein [Fibrobacter sp.]